MGKATTGRNVKSARVGQSSTGKPLKGVSMPMKNGDSGAGGQGSSGHGSASKMPSGKMPRSGK